MRTEVLNLCTWPCEADRKPVGEMLGCIICKESEGGAERGADSGQEAGARLRRPPGHGEGLGTGGVRGI